MTHTVFILEDSPYIMSLIETYMKERPDLKLVGVEGDGEVGLQKVLELKPRLLILDLVLPNMSGLEVAEKVLNSELKIEIMGMSSLESDYVQEQLQQLGVRHFLQKPFTKDEFLNLLDSVQL